MPALHNTITIAAPPEEVWRVVGDLAAAPEWVPGVVEAKVDAATRICRTADGAEIEEDIDVDPADHSWSYRQSRVPLPISDSRGTMRVTPSGDGAEVVWDAEFEVVGQDEEQTTAMIDGYYRQALESLRRRIEDAGR
jgi:uncharacterized protein YndB with AHSA1/START domain